MKFKLYTALLFLIIIPLFSNEQFAEVFEEQMASMPYVSEPNPSHLICFSGTFGMGKTRVAKALQHHFKAIRVSSDEAREIFRKKGIHLNLVHDYMLYFLKELRQRSPNQMVILDCSIDRTFDAKASLAKEYDYPLFLIRMLVPYEKVKERLQARGDTVSTVEKFLKNLDQNWREYEQFGEGRVFDFYLNNDDYVTYDALIDAIESKRTLDVKQDLRQKIIEFADNGPQVPYKAYPLSEIIPGLYLSNQNLANLISEKSPLFISNILSLRSKNAYSLTSKKILYKQMEVHDLIDTQIETYFDEAFNFIENAQKGVLVHCKEGRSRSVSIVVAYLMWKYDLPFSIAYTYVKKKHPIASPNRGFIKQLQHYSCSRVNAHVCSVPL
jgi:protein phosphatase slingshot